MAQENGTIIWRINLEKCSER